MECKNFEELLYRDLLISDSMEKNTLKEFPSEERKTLMQIIFPLQTDGLFYNLYHSMTLEGYTGKIISMSQRRLDTGLFQWGSQAYQRLADLVVNDISAEAAELYRGPAQGAKRGEGLVLKNTFVPLDKQSKKAQRAAVRANRALWQGVKLCPRIMRKKTDYRRKGRRVDALDT